MNFLEHSFFLFALIINKPLLFFYTMIKKMAIAGMGISGSFLYRLLIQAGYEPKDIDCYDIKRPERCGIKSCAFGVYGKEFSSLLKSVSLDAENYILNSFNEMYFDDQIANCGLCTINKPKLLKDLIGDQTIKILDECEKIDTGNYDLVVDATGFARVYLPLLKDDLNIPTLQYKIKSEDRTATDGRKYVRIRLGFPSRRERISRGYGVSLLRTHEAI